MIQEEDETDTLAPWLRLIAMASSEHPSNQYIVRLFHYHAYAYGKSTEELRGLGKIFRKCIAHEPY